MYSHGLIFPALGGLAAGAIHALSGPDHVAAVLPLAAEAPGRAVRTALTWALGHGLGTALLAAAALIAREGLDLAPISMRAEWLVGSALILTGARALRPHRHPDAPRTPPLALSLGALHGLAGGAHAVAALTALALPAPLAIGWLAAFVIGAGAAMGLIGLGAARIGGEVSAARLAQLRAGAGALAVVVGGIWLIV